jgi:general secretion pathway protein K
MKPDPRQFEILQRLLEGLGLPTALAFALQDWLDADDDPASGVGAEDRYYLTLPVPYRSANALLTHLDELRLVRGFSPQIIEKLRPYVTALPEYAPINVNTAPRPVLAAVLQGVTDAELDTLMSRRERLPFRDLAEVRGAIQGPDKLLEENSLTTASRYFLANISARRGDSSIDLACLIRRQAGRTEIVWQRFE